MTFDDIFLDTPVMAILRAQGIKRSLELAQTAWESGIAVVEVTLQSAEDLDALAAVSAAAAPYGAVVGAGTVLTPRTVVDAADAGAAFTVSPGLDLDVIEASHAVGLPSLPGVATATEVQRACATGLTWLKAFPAESLGTSWFSAMRGPFPACRFVATGGMTSANAPTFLDVGVSVVAVGSALRDPRELERLGDLLRR